MSILATRQPPTKRPGKLKTFAIHFLIGADTYAIGRLDADPSIAKKAFRFRKLTGDGASYDVRLTEHGPECECMGFLRHQHCKHAETLVSAGKLFGL